MRSYGTRNGDSQKKFKRGFQSDAFVVRTWWTCMQNVTVWRRRGIYMTKCINEILSTGQQLLEDMRCKKKSVPGKPLSSFNR